MENSENYSADKPLENANDDKFQRYNFSKRIAETILNRKSRESIVIGLYGAWGEGKSTVLNFIKNEIKPQYPNVIQFSFNPWRFTDEAALLTSYFNTLASELKKSLKETENLQALSSNISNPDIPKEEVKKSWWSKKKGPLKTNSETIGEIISDYGKIMSIVGAGETAEAIGKALSNVDIDSLKERIETLLEKHKRKIIVFIDDIDRLDKDEIHAIFRLVKLTGDFAYTTYLLSFDNNKVAESIGERFGSGDKSAGEDFLEKIIQVPLTLPKAQKAALKNYCFKLVENALETNKIIISEKDASKFAKDFTDSLLIRLNTPRLAVQYSNALSFSLPLLHGEVNLVDLMLIEAIRVFYPRHYEMIKDKSDFFLQAYSGIYSGGNANDSNKEQFKSELQKTGIDLNDKEKEHIQSLLVDLFPNLDGVYSNTHYDNSIYDRWYKEKRVCSPYYFNRYFSYAVIDGDISDIAFENLLKLIKEKTIEEIGEEIGVLISNVKATNFITRINVLREDLDLETAKKLSFSIAKVGNLFPPLDSVLPFGSLCWQAAQFIFKVSKLETDKDKRFEFIKKALETSHPFYMAFEIFRNCRNGESGQEERPLTDEQYIQGFVLLKNLALKESGAMPLFDKFPDYSFYLCEAWNEYNKVEFEAYIKSFIEKDPKMALNFIRAMTSTIVSTSSPLPFKGDFDKDTYEKMKRLIDVSYLYRKAIEAFGNDIISDAIVFTHHFEQIEQTDENILKQFAYWYNKENSSNDKKDK